jgi:hypothetical protein
MPNLSGYFKRTSGKQLMMLVMTHIETFIAAKTFPRTRSDAKLARIHIHASSPYANISSKTSRSAATVWLRAGKERQPETAIHRLPFHMPEPDVFVATWRPRECIPRVKTHLKSYGIMPQTHLQNIHRTEAIVQLWQDRLQYTVRRHVTTGKLMHNTRPAVFTLLNYEIHIIYDKYNLKSANNLAN